MDFKQGNVKKITKFTANLSAIEQPFTNSASVLLVNLANNCTWIQIAHKWFPVNNNGIKW